MSNAMIKHAITAVLAMGIAGSGTAAFSEPASNDTAPGMEKCYGAAKSGKNDCATATHGCSGEARMDYDKDEWISVPKGQCQKIINGIKKDAQR